VEGLLREMDVPFREAAGNPGRLEIAWEDAARAVWGAPSVVTRHLVGVVEGAAGVGFGGVWA
jgi:hypothetical protein